MTKHIRRGGKLIHQSMAVIRKHKKLMIFPVSSSILVLLLLTSIITPLSKYENTRMLMEKGQLHHFLWLYVILLVFLFISHQFVFYFNAALTACAQQYFKGKTPSLAAGLKTARQHILKMFLWNLFASTIGIMINLTQSQLRKYPFYKNLFLDLSWGAATYLATSVIMAEEM